MILPFPLTLRRLPPAKWRTDFPINEQPLGDTEEAINAFPYRSRS
jgi:hypothetical protein